MLPRTLTSFTILMYLNIYLLKSQTFWKTCTILGLLHKDVPLICVENILDNQTKFEVNLKRNFQFCVRHKKRINKILQSHCGHYNKIKVFLCNPGIPYVYKLHKAKEDNCSPFRPILQAIKAPAYETTKFLMPKLFFNVE